MAFLEAPPAVWGLAPWSTDDRPRWAGVVEATAALGVPVVVNMSWGGLELDEVPAHVYVVNDVP